MYKLGMVVSYGLEGVCAITEVRHTRTVFVTRLSTRTLSLRLIRTISPRTVHTRPLLSAITTICLS